MEVPQSSPNYQPYVTDETEEPEPETVPQQNQPPIEETDPDPMSKGKAPEVPNQNTDNEPENESAMVPAVDLDTTSPDIPFIIKEQRGAEVENRRMDQDREQYVQERQSSPPARPHREEDIRMGNVEGEVPRMARKRDWSQINFGQQIFTSWFAAEEQNRRLHQNGLPPPPNNWQQAQEHPHWDKWLQAAKEELHALEQKETWEVVQIPKGIFITPVRWVFTYKFDEKGYLVKHKARLCVRGDLQRRFGNIGDTRALTLATRVLRCMMTLAAAFDLDIDQMDVSNAFFYNICCYSK